MFYFAQNYIHLQQVNNNNENTYKMSDNNPDTSLQPILSSAIFQGYLELQWKFLT